MRDREPNEEVAGSLSRDTIHDLLASSRRRAALGSLLEHGDLALPDLADEVARHEHDAPVSEIDEDDVLGVYLSLWHVHVPKLADSDVVSYDQERDVVAPGKNADQLEALGQLETLTAGETA